MLPQAAIVSKQGAHQNVKALQRSHINIPTNGGKHGQGKADGTQPGSRRTPSQTRNGPQAVNALQSNGQGGGNLAKSSASAKQEAFFHHRLSNSNANLKHIIKNYKEETQILSNIQAAQQNTNAALKANTNTQLGNQLKVANQKSASQPPLRNSHQGHVQRSSAGNTQPSQASSEAGFQDYQ